MQSKSLSSQRVNQFSQPALRITARDRKSARHVHVRRFNVASALLALLNMELPLAAKPPMPSPLGLCSSTKTINRRPVPIQLQDKIEVSIKRKEEVGQSWGWRPCWTWAQSGFGQSWPPAAEGQEFVATSERYRPAPRYHEV